MMYKIIEYLSHYILINSVDNITVTINNDNHTMEKENIHLLN